MKRVKRIIQSAVNTLGYEISRHRPKPPIHENPITFLSPQDNAVPLCFASFGEANPDRVFYVIYLGRGGSGFFSNVFHVLGHLTLAERLHMTPVVDMRRFPTLYNESEPVNGTCNAWEYYFAQPAGFSLDDVYRSRHVAFCDGNHRRGPSLARFRWNVYDNPLATIPAAQRFLRVRAPIQEEVEAFYTEFFLGKTVLGVHFRGQEHKTAPDRWACPTVEQMLARTRMLLAAYPIDAVFLVTEEQAYLDAYTAAFHGMVLHTAAFRTYDLNAYRIRPYPRPLHMYRLGLDVLKDTMLLARADYLLAGGANGLAVGSNVSLMAQVWNAGAYKHIELIDNGINPPSTRTSIVLRVLSKALGLDRKFGLERSVARTSQTGLGNFGDGTESEKSAG